MRQPNPTSTSVGRSAATLLALGCAGIAVAQSVLYVSPSGRDEWSGTMKYATRNRTDGPKKTMAGARDAIRLLKAQGRLDPKGAIVYLASGTYPVTSTITFDSRDSGTAEGPIVYRAQVQGKAILDGGKKLTIWSSVSPSVAAYLKPEVRNKVMQCRLGQLRLTRGNAGEMARRGDVEQWATPPAFLTWDGKMMPMASTGDDGSWLLTPTDQSSSTSFVTSREKARAYTYDSDVWVGGYLGTEWSYTFSKVASVDPVSGLTTLASAPPFGIKPNARYQFTNVLEELDSPGEWYLDRRSMLLVFYPPVRSLVGSKANLALLATEILRLDPGSPSSMHLRFEGLIFQNARGGGYEGAMVVGKSGPSDIGFYGCVFRGCARAAATTGNMYEPSTNNWTFDSCDFHDLGGAGVKLNGGDRAALQSGGHKVQNCRFWSVSQLSRTYSPAVGLSGVGATIRHCVFEDMPHTVIMPSGNDHLIEWNVFRRVVSETADAGAVYAGRNWTMQGTVVRNNLFDNVVRTRTFGGETHGASCVYMDDAMSGWTIESNLFVNCDIGVNVSGRDTNILNNVFWECGIACRVADWIPFPAADPIVPTLMANLAAVPYDTSPIWIAKYPKLAMILADGKPRYMRRTKSVSNVFASCATPVLFGSWNPMSYAYADDCTYYRGPEYSGSSPGFVDFPRSLALLPGSAASVCGFTPWNVSSVGNVQSQYRPSIGSQ